MGERFPNEKDSRKTKKDSRKTKSDSRKTKSELIEEITELRRRLATRAGQGDASRADESETYFRAVVENSPATIAVRDVEGRFRMVNRRYEETFGLKREDILGLSVRDVFPEEVAEAYIALDEQTVRTGQPSEYERELQRWDGTLGTMMVNKFPILNGDGTAVAVATISTDVTERKKAQEALEKSEERFRTLVESTNIVAWEMDLATWRFTYVSPHAVELLGYPLEAWYREGFWEAHLHPDDRESSVRFCKAATQRCQDHDFEYRMITAAGATVWLRDIVTVICGGDGPVSLRGFLIDVSERKRAEIALRDSEERFRNLVEGSVQGIVIAKGDRPLFVNKAYAKIFGYDDPADILALGTLDALYDPAEIPRIHGYRRLRAAGEETPDHYAFRGQTRQGAEIWVETQVRSITWEGEVVTQATVVDITERKKAEDALKQSEARFRDIAESASDWFWEMDETLRYTFFSDRRQQVTGLASDGALGKTRWEVVGADPDTEDKWRAHREVLEAHEPFRDFRYVYTDAEGGAHHWNVSGVPVFDEDGAFKGYRGSASDITDRVLAEDKLRGAVENLNDGFALYDADDRLVMCNDEYRRLHPEANEMLKPGMRFEDMIRKVADSGTLVDAIAREEDYIRERLERHRSPQGPILRQRRDGTWYILREARTPDGGTCQTVTDVTELRKAEEALSESEARFRTLTDGSSQGILVQQNFRPLYVNPAFVKMFGYDSADEILALDSVELLFSPQEREGIRVNHEARLRGEMVPNDYEFRGIRKDGSEIWLSNRPFRIKWGGEWAVCTTLFDITQRRRAEGLRQGRGKVLERMAAGAPLDEVLGVLLETTEEAQPEMVCSVMLLDKDGKHLRPAAAPSMPDFFSQAIDGLEIRPGMGCCRGGCADDDTVIVEDIRSEPYWAGLRAVAGKAGLRACWSKPICSPGGDVLGTLAIFYRDLRQPDASDVELIETAAHLAGIAIERHQAESALRESEERFRAVVNHSPTKIHIKDRDGRYLLVNRLAEKLFHVTQEQARGKKTDDIFPADMAKIFKEHDQAVIETGEAIESEERFQLDNGVHTFLTVKFPIRDAAGETVAVGAIGTDITERKRAEKLLLGRSKVLERMAAGAPLHEVLTVLVETTEEVQPDMICSVLLLDKDKKRLRHGAGPNLPDFYNEAVDGFEIGVGMGACGTAATSGETVIVEDVTVHPYCEPFRPYLARANLRAVWSQPIFSSAGEVLGTFAIYYHQPRKPAPADLDLIKTAAHLAGIAIERHRAQDALRDSEERFRAVVDNSPSAILLKDADGRYVLSNQTFNRWFDARGPEGILGKTTHDFFAAEEAERILADDREVLEGGRAVVKEVSLRCPDGRKRVTITQKFPIPGPDGRYVALGAILTDITDKKEAEAALRESEERFRALIENSPVAVGVKDIEGRYLLVNQRYQELFGLKPEEVEGKTAHELFPAELAEAYQKNDRDALTEGLVYEREGTVRHADGTTRVTKVTKFPIMGADKKPVALGFIARDITGQKEIEQQLSEARKMEALGQLTGGVAHDFNNLLTVILGNLQLLERRVPVDERLGKYVELAIGAAKSGADLTQRLLAFARRQILEPKVFGVNELISDMQTLLRGMVGETVQIYTALGDAPWQVRTDPNQLENALLNLAINARDAMPDGGTLTIETANVTLDGDYVAQNAEVVEGDYVMVAVTDTGTGIPADLLERVFEPFYTTKDVSKGTGMGLSMVYGFIKQSGGHIKVYSEVGHGTTIKLYIPRADAAEGKARNGQPLDGEIQGSETILVVEDNPGVRETVIELLDELGYNVIEANNGPAALGVLDRRDGIDLVFTDIVMPGGMTGADLAREAQKRRPGIRVLFTSGYAENGIVRGGTIETGVAFLSKPFQKQELAERVRQVLDQRVLDQ